MRTRALKRILTAIGALCVLGTVGASAAACGAYRVIDARGSSSVQPFLNALAQAYTNPENYPDRKIEISVQAGGSALGITSAANGQTMIGTASKSPYDSVSSDPSLLEAWKTNQIKTVTLAKDGIALLLYAPAGYAGTDFVIDGDNIANLYNAFAGYQTVPLSTFLADQNASHGDLDGINIHGFARSGGSSASGTGEAFFTDSGINFDANNLPNTTKKALENGIYGENTTQTNESNAEAYGNFETNAPSRGYGSMIYLSLGYVENNLQKIKDSGFVVVSYKNSKDVDSVIPSIDSVNAGTYGWVRPFNAMVSLAHNAQANDKIDDVEHFIDWILFSGYGYDDDVSYKGSSQTTPADLINKIFGDEGIIPLKPEEIDSMFVSNGQNKNDVAQEKFDLSDFWRPDSAFDGFPAPNTFGVNIT